MQVHGHQVTLGSTDSGAFSSDVPRVLSTARALRSVSALRGDRAFVVGFRHFATGWAARCPSACPRLCRLAVSLNFSSRGPPPAVRFQILMENTPESSGGSSQSLSVCDRSQGPCVITH